MNTIKAIISLITTNKPIKKFNIECQLMLHFSKKYDFLRKFFQRRLYYVYGCEISHTASIHKSVKFVHPIAVVVGSQAVIEENCIIYQCVTIGTTFNCNNKMPTIKSGTIVSAGAKLIGDITIGRNCIIGANAVVTKSVPDNMVVTSANKLHPKKITLNNEETPF